MVYREVDSLVDSKKPKCPKENYFFILNFPEDFFKNLPGSCRL